MDIIRPILFLVATQLSILTVDRNPVDLKLLSAQSISLEKRYDNKYVNDIFKDNILLNIAYLDGRVEKKEDINWDGIKKPFNYKFTLLPNQTFAYHEDVLPQYKNTVVKTTNANFNFDDGFKSDGYLTGDGVCHLASLMYWVAKNAGIKAIAPTNHDFAPIPQISRVYGVAIYKMPGNLLSNARQNLYITNNRKNPVIFEFNYKNSNLSVSIFEAYRKSI